MRYCYKRGGYNSIEPNEAERSELYDIVIAKDKVRKRFRLCKLGLVIGAAFVKYLTYFNGFIILSRLIT